MADVRIPAIATGVIVLAMTMTVMGGLSATFFGALSDSVAAISPDLERDSSGNRNHLTILGDPTLTEDSFAPFGRGAELDGDDDGYLDATSFNTTNGFAAVVAVDWVTGSLTEVSVISFRDGETWTTLRAEVRFRDTDLDGDGVVNFAWWTGAGIANLNGATVYNNGQHILGLHFDGTTYRVYVNGVLEIETAPSPLEAGPSNRITFGVTKSFNPPAREFMRGLYQAHVWDNQPSTATIQAQTDPLTAVGTALGGEYGFYTFEAHSTSGDKTTDETIVSLRPIYVLTAVGAFLAAVLGAFALVRRE